MSAFNPSQKGYTNFFDPTRFQEPSSVATTGLVGCDPNNLTKTLLAQITDEASQLYGLKIIYYRQNFDPKKTHPIYGESNAEFLEGKVINALVDITVDSSMLTYLGIENDNKLDLQISYEEFVKSFGPTATPQNGDKFEIKDLLCDRPSGFTRAIFQVDSQGDSDIFEVYKRWFISGNRSDFAYIENEPQETPFNDVFDSNYAGPVDKNTHMPLTEDPQGQDNKQEFDIEEISKEQYKEENSDAYGGYYDDGIYFED